MAAGGRRGEQGAVALAASAAAVAAQNEAVRLDQIADAAEDEWQLVVGPAGVRLLSEHLLAGSHRVRFRVRGPLRLNAGSARSPPSLGGTLTRVVRLDASP